MDGATTLACAPRWYDREGRFLHSEVAGRLCVGVICASMGKKHVLGACITVGLFVCSQAQFETATSKDIDQGKNQIGHRDGSTGP